MPLIENSQAPGTYMLPMAVPLAWQTRPPLEGILVRVGQFVGCPKAIYSLAAKYKAGGKIPENRATFINGKLFIHERRGQVVIIENDNSYKLTINQSWYD